MDLAHICINLFARSAKHVLVDAAQPQNVSKSQHGNEDYDVEKRATSNFVFSNSPIA